MILLLSLISTFGVVYLVCSQFGDGGRRIFLVLALGVLTVISMVRGAGVGTDTNSYRLYFVTDISALTTHLPGSGLQQSAPVYWLFEIVVSIFSTNPQAITAATALVTGILVTVFIWRMRVNPLLAVVLYVGMFFYPFSMNGARQFLAVAISMNALRLLNHRRYLWFVVLTIVAIGVHPLAVVNVLFIPLAVVIRTKHSARNVAVVAVLVSLLIVPLIRVFTYFFPRYDIYLSDVRQGETIASTGQGRILYYNIFLAIFVCVLLVLLWHLKVVVDEEYRLPIAIFVVGVIVSIPLSGQILIQRVFIFLMVYGIVVLPKLLQLATRGVRQGPLLRVLLTIILVLAVLGACAIRLIGGEGDIIPYSTFFTNPLIIV